MGFQLLIGIKNSHQIDREKEVADLSDFALQRVIDTGITMTSIHAVEFNAEHFYFIEVSKQELYGELENKFSYQVKTLYEASKALDSISDTSGASGTSKTPENSNESLLPTLTILDTAVVKSSKEMQVFYTLSHSSNQSLRFIWSTFDGTARSNQDYARVTGRRVEIAPGVAGGVLRIPLLTDGLDEDNENFQVIVEESSVNGIHLAGSKLSAQVTILDTDAPPALTFSDVVVAEGARRVAIPFTLSHASSKVIRFTWSTKDLSAHSAEDYAAVSSQAVVISPGTLSGTLSVNIYADETGEEKGEYFYIHVDRGSMVNISRHKGRLGANVVIQDDE